MSVEKRFLIIDDSYIDRLVSGMLIKRAFQNAEVVEAAGGNQALEWLKEMKITGQLVIVLDIMMPHMNGFEFLEHFEKLRDEVKKNTIIVMLSSTLDLDDMNKAKEHVSVKKLLSKPLLANELKQLIGV